MFNVMVVEDDKTFRKVVATSLSKNGYKVFEAEDGSMALDILDKDQIDLIISDIMMPNIDGFELTKELREADYNMPILFITAKEHYEDKARAFNSGIDDYMVKPIDLNEMLLRVAALLRRAKIANEHKLTFGDTVLDYDSLTVYDSNGIEQQLPQKEFYLLFKLLSYPGKIFTRTQLMDEIWGMDSESDERTVDVHINRIRDRFKNNADFQLVTVRGLGYKAAKQDA